LISIFLILPFHPLPTCQHSKCCFWLIHWSRSI